MTAITLEVIEAKQSELNTLIEQLRASTKAVIVEVPGANFQLRPGERYAGIELDESGEPLCHLILLPGYGENLTWDEARQWADAQGGVLPSRRAQSLLFANCKQHLQPRWHWSCEEHEDDASCAWYCFFGYGYQFIFLKSYRGSAVAVRRLSV
ncbi:MAG: DUF1566 domain-containing protein [Ottowia sp.]|uniref:DUF1566 domain-containing protein n=1 Tax=Ottowia sp. TaxID=1898956 RepID=UPI003C78B71E